MKFIEFTTSGYELSRYLRYLAEIDQSLPHGAKEFMHVVGRFDLHHPMCLHDSWLDSLIVHEIGTGERGQLRELAIHLRLLGNAHDGFHEIKYQGVCGYTLMHACNTSALRGVAHGDVVIDELILTPRGTVSHEMLFSEGATWQIECRDVCHSWRHASEVY